MLVNNIIDADTLFIAYKSLPINEQKQVLQLIMQNENAWQQKNLLVQQAANDALFLDDLHEVNEWFEPVNFETLNPNLLQPQINPQNQNDHRRITPTKLPII